MSRGLYRKQTEFSQNPLIINTTKRVAAGLAAIDGKKRIKAGLSFKKIPAPDFFGFS
jgi:hypothetical protein